MPSDSFRFLLFMRFRKSLKKIFSELDQNLRRFFMRRNEDRLQSRRGGLGATDGFQVRPEGGLCPEAAMALEPSLGFPLHLLNTPRTKNRGAAITGYWRRDWANFVRRAQ